MAEEMMENFLSILSSDISSLQCLCEKRITKQSREKKNQYFNGSTENIELLLRTVISAIQLSIYGAITELCDEVPKDLRAPGKPAAPDHLEKKHIPADLSKVDNTTNAQQRRNLVQEYE